MNQTRDNLPNYTNMHNMDPSRMEPCRRHSEPVKPDMDYRVICPSCGSQPYFGDCGGIVVTGAVGRVWVGAYCPACGQKLDLSDLNEPDTARDIKRIPGNDSIRPGQVIGTKQMLNAECGMRNEVREAGQGAPFDELGMQASLAGGDWVKSDLHEIPYRYDQVRPCAERPLTMSNAEAISVLERLETDIYGRIAIGKAIDALRKERK